MIDIDKDLQNAYSDGFTDGYILGQKYAWSQWIPCSERLPEVGVNVLLSSGKMFTAEGCLRDDGDWCQFRWSTTWTSDYVDAWMPLPKPYEKRE